MPTLIFKETEACNSNCIYCDVIARKKPRTISIDKVEKVFFYININRRSFYGQSRIKIRSEKSNQG